MKIDKEKFWSSHNISQHDIKQAVKSLSVSELKLFIENANNAGVILPEPVKKAVFEKIGKA